MTQAIPKCVDSKGYMIKNSGGNVMRQWLSFLFERKAIVIGSGSPRKNCSRFPVPVSVRILLILPFPQRVAVQVLKR